MPVHLVADARYTHNHFSSVMRYPNDTSVETLIDLETKIVNNTSSLGRFKQFVQSTVEIAHSLHMLGAIPKVGEFLTRRVQIALSLNLVPAIPKSCYLVLRLPFSQYQ